MATVQPVSSKSKVHTVYRNSRGEEVPGVTTALNILAKPALIHWAWDLGIKGIDYRVHRDELADVGTLVHKMVLCDLAGEECDVSEYSKKQIDLAENGFLSYLEWKRRHEIIPVLIEEPLISDTMGFGGTPDFFGMVDDSLVLMDFKTGKGIYDEFFYQMAAYRHLLIEDLGYEIEDCRILRIGRDESEGFEEAVRQDALDGEWRIFLHALGIHSAKKKTKKRRR